MALHPDDEITGSEDLISYTDVRARLAVLRPFHVEDTRVPETAMVDSSIASYDTREEAEHHIAVHGAGVREHLTVVEYSDESEKLAALRDLEAKMARNCEASALHERWLTAPGREAPRRAAKVVFRGSAYYLTA